MKAEKGVTCVVCGITATRRSFDGTGFCHCHALSWQKYLVEVIKNSEKWQDINAIFEQWKTEAKAGQD